MRTRAIYMILLNLLLLLGEYEFLSLASILIFGH